MGPLGAIIYFFSRVAFFVKSGIDWRHQIDQYEIDKSYRVPEMYRFSIFPLDFIPVRNSQLAADTPTYGNINGRRTGNNDYAHTYIKISDIYPFILNAKSTFVDVRSFNKNKPSEFDGLRLYVAAGYVLGSDGLYHIIDANHVAYDQKGTPGILAFYLDPALNNPARNRILQTIDETGKAYTLAPNVEPNILTKLQVAIHGNELKYSLILFLIIASMAYIATEEKK
jgi:hypothetical protein